MTSTEIPEKTTVGSLDIYPPDPEIAGNRWTVSGDLRAQASQWEVTNNDIARHVAIEVGLRGNVVEGTVEYDPEISCFFAYCETEVDAHAIALLAHEVAEVVAPEVEVASGVETVTKDEALMVTAALTLAADLWQGTHGKGDPDIALLDRVTNALLNGRTIEVKG